MNMEILNIIIGALIGFLPVYIIYRLSRKDTLILQKGIWKKEFDRYQTEPMIAIFKQIMSVLHSNATAKIKRTISQKIIGALKIETRLIRYFNEDTRKQIDSIYKECLAYNDIIIRRSTQPEKSKTERTSIKMENENKIEKEKRETIERTIIEVIDEIKSIYSEF